MLVAILPADQAGVSCKCQPRVSARRTARNARPCKCSPRVYFRGGSTHFTVESATVRCTTVQSLHRTVTDPITALVHKLLTAEDPDELRILREQLNRAIHERLEELRKELRVLVRLGGSPPASCGDDDDEH